MKCAVSGLVLIDPDIETAPAALASNQGFFSLLCPPPRPPPATEKASPCEEHPIPGAGKAARWARAGSLCWWSC